MSTAHRSSRRIAGWVSALIAGLLILTACGGEEAAAPDPVTDDPATEDAAASGDDAEAEPVNGMAELDTITPGVIKVAIQPYAPYTDYVDGELTGLDSDVLHAMAEKWGYEVEVEVTDFAGMLGGVQSRRVDTSIGGIAWTAERQEQGLFTDPVYYSPPAMAVSNGEQYSKIADLEGLNLGTVEGYVWVQSIEDIPGATLHAYPDATGVIDDLGAGRIDVGFLDLFLLTYAETTRPELGIETQYLEPPTEEEIAEHPGWAYLAPYTVNFYVAPQSPKLQEAMDEVIHEMYANGEMAALIEQYGGDPSAILTPYDGVAEARIGIDRPDGWQPPSV